MLINVKFLGCGKEMKNVLKLRISYDTEEELKKAINILNPVVKKVKSIAIMIKEYINLRM